MIRLFMFQLAYVLACLLTPSAALAGLEVSPVIVNIPYGQKATTISVRNSGDTPRIVQVRVFDWSQDRGRDILNPSDLLQVSPPIFELAPQQYQVLRLVAGDAAVASGEASFRLFVDELPVLSDQSTIYLPVRFNLPVFMAAEPQAQAQLEWKAAWASEKKLQLTLKNRGKKHSRISHLVLESPSTGQKLTSIKGLAGYALAGQEYQWIFEVPGKSLAGKLKITAVQDQTPLDVTVNVDPL